MAKKVPVSNEDRKKSYFKYYADTMYYGEQERYDMISDKPWDNALALHIDNRNDLFLPGDLPGEFGWWLMEDGTALIANKTFFPGLTGEMFDWWFAWHPIDRLRYACWDNEDHYDVYLEDPAKALDFSKSMRERHWGSIHHIWEDIGDGAGPSLIQLHFYRPSDMGYDESKMDTELCSTLICSNGKTLGGGDMPDFPVTMAHFLRPVEGGCVLRSRFWFGWQIIDKKAVKMIPDGFRVPAIAPTSLLRHNIKEFSNLSRILPSIYAEEKDRWI